MPLEHLELLAVLEADDVVVRHRFLDRNRRLEFDLGLLLRRSKPRERRIDRLDQAGQFRARHRIIRNMRRNDFGRQGHQFAVLHAFVRHSADPFDSSAIHRTAAVPVLQKAAWRTSNLRLLFRTFVGKYKDRDGVANKFRKFFIDYLSKNGFKLFGYYRIVLGVALLLIHYFVMPLTVI